MAARADPFPFRAAISRSADVTRRFTGVSRFRKGSIGTDGVTHAVPLAYEDEPMTACWRSPVVVQLGGWFQGSDDGACSDCALRVAMLQIREYSR